MKLILMNDKEKLIKFCKESSSIVVNTDLDGIFSAALIRSVNPNLEISGLTDSHTKLFYTNEKLKNDLEYKKNALFLDLYVTNESIRCIDQHIVSFDEPIEMDNKINPNVTYKIGCNKYFSKYPFSTSLYILFLLKKNNIIIYINFDEKIFDDVTLCDLLLRCDSSLKNNITYKPNVKKWFNILNSSDDIKEIYERYIIYDDKEIIEKTNKIDLFLKKSFGCFESGGFELSLKNKNIFQDYVNFIFNFFNDKIDIIDIFHTKIFKEEKNMKITEINKNIDLSNVFSLAYVKNKKLNVSYG